VKAGDAPQRREGSLGCSVFALRAIKTSKLQGRCLQRPDADSCSPPQEVFNGLIKCVWSFQVRNVPNVR
jgi:hypothetical protein